MTAGKRKARRRRNNELNRRDALLRAGRGPACNSQ